MYSPILADRVKGSIGGALLPGGHKLCKITQKGMLKISFIRGKLGALQPPILTKSGRKG